LRLPLPLSVFALHDSLSVCLSVCYSCILILYFVYDFNNNNNRTFCSRVNEMLAAVVKLISGVIHGSVIGPLMFLMYINDLIVLLSQYNIKLKLSADDIKLYVKILTILIMYYRRHYLPLLPGPMNGSCLCLLISVVYCMFVKACVLLLNSLNSMILLYP